MKVETGAVFDPTPIECVDLTSALDKEKILDDIPSPRSVVWLGNSRKNILEFPAKVRKQIGDELQLIQFGGMPKDAKAFKGVGSGARVRCLPPV